MFSLHMQNLLSLINDSVTMLQQQSNATSNPDIQRLLQLLRLAQLFISLCWRQTDVVVAVSVFQRLVNEYRKRNLGDPMLKKAAQSAQALADQLNKPLPYDIQQQADEQLEAELAISHPKPPKPQQQQPNAKSAVAQFKQLLLSKQQADLSPVYEQKNATVYQQVERIASEQFVKTPLIELILLLAQLKWRLSEVQLAAVILNRSEPAVSQQITDALKPADSLIGSEELQQRYSQYKTNVERRQAEMKEEKQLQMQRDASVESQSFADQQLAQNKLLLQKLQKNKQISLNEIMKGEVARHKKIDRPEPQVEEQAEPVREYSQYTPEIEFDPQRTAQAMAAEHFFALGNILHDMRSKVAILREEAANQSQEEQLKIKLEELMQERSLQLHKLQENINSLDGKLKTLDQFDALAAKELADVRSALFLSNKQLKDEINALEIRMSSIQM